jgi:hypothetical protein
VPSFTIDLESYAMRDYFAELFVAGRFAEGFDFLIAKDTGLGHQLIRPVQVKGKYPTEGKTNKPRYGYAGKLTQVHPEMVLAIPFFPIESQEVPSCVAFLPFSLVRTHSRGYRCQPAMFREGVPVPRRDHRQFFDKEGLELLERDDWSATMLSRRGAETSAGKRSSEPARTQS